MLKWLILLFTTLIFAWIFLQSHIPATMRDSKFAYSVNASVVSLDYYIKGKFPQYRTSFSAPVIKPSTIEEINSLAIALENSGKPFLIAIFDLNSLSERLSFNSLKKYLTSNKKISFIFIIASENQSKATYYLSQLQNNNLTYLTIDKKNVFGLRPFFVSRNIQFVETPLIAFSTGSYGDLYEVTSGYFAGSRIDELLKTYPSK